MWRWLAHTTRLTRLAHPARAARLGAAVAVIATLAAAASAPAVAQTATATLDGTVIARNGGDFTVLQPGAVAGRINEMISYATRLAAKHYRYVYGGGHGRPGVPTAGTGGKVKGFDCSGAVVAVLAAAGLWPRDEAVPGDLGVIDDLLHAKVIARGPGVGPDSVDLFDRPNADIQMNIEGDFFGTGYTGNGGPGFMGDIDAAFPGYKEYHVLPSALADHRSYRQQITFEYPDDAAGYRVFSELTTGAKVQVTYRQHDGVLYAVAATNLGGTPFRPVGAGSAG